MSIFKKKPAPAPTLSERHALALANTESTLSLFESAARRLESSAVTHDDVYEQAENQIEELLVLQRQAGDASDRAQRQASKIRDLLG